MQQQPRDMTGRAWAFLTDLFIAPGGRISQASLTEGGLQAMRELENFGFVWSKHFNTDQRGDSHSLHQYWMLTDDARIQFEGMSQ